LDIGACRGYYALEFARRVGNKGKVYAFEPDKENFSMLKKNIESSRLSRNKISNIVLVNKAVSDKTGKLKLYIADFNKADHRIFADSKDKRSFVEIESVSIDAFMDNNIKNRIKLVKMDVQGAEVKVVEGMRRLLESNKEFVLLTEFWPYGLKGAGSSGQKYLKMLRKHFALYDMNEHTEKIEPAVDKILLKEHTVKNMTYTNLLCIRRDDVKKYSKVLYAS